MRVGRATVWVKAGFNKTLLTGGRTRGAGTVGGQERIGCLFRHSAGSMGAGVVTSVQWAGEGA